MKFNIDQMINYKDVVYKIHFVKTLTYFFATPQSYLRLKK